MSIEKAGKLSSGNYRVERIKNTDIILSNVYLGSRMRPLYID